MGLASLKVRHIGNGSARNVRWVRRVHRVTRAGEIVEEAMVFRASPAKFAILRLESPWRAQAGRKRG
jgi:hypothetical protein